MKVVHLTHNDSVSGAGRAAYRVHSTLLENGLNSIMIVSEKNSKNSFVYSTNDNVFKSYLSKFKQFFEFKFSKLLSKDYDRFISLSIFDQINLSKDKRVLSADIINLYWINGAFIKPANISDIKKPIVWRLSDVWPFTGGCHYSGGCKQYIDGCFDCPQIHSIGSINFSKSLLRDKIKKWSNLNLTIVAPSNWIAKLAKESLLFSKNKVLVIPTGVNTNFFKPINQNISRKKINIPLDKKVILFGGMSKKIDPRKGFHLLKIALDMIYKEKNKDDFMVILFGSNHSKNYTISLKNKYFGLVNDEHTLRNLYSSADIVVVPSLEDNLPNVALEAIACGKPVVGFDVCGMSDIVKNGWNGFLAKPLNGNELFKHIKKIFSNYSQLSMMGKNSRLHAKKNFSQEIQAKRLIDLYSSLVDQNE